MRIADDLKKIDLPNSSLREEINFVKLNKERTSVATKLATQLNNGVPPPSYRKGVIPKYNVTIFHNNFSCASAIVHK